MLLANPWLLALFNLGVGMILGSILFRSDFCMAGILRDVFLFGDRTLLNALFLAVILTMFLFLLGDAVTLFQVWPRATEAAVWLLAGRAGLLFIRWQRQGKWQVVAGCQGYMQPWRVAIALALLNLAVYFFSGWPMGISTAYAKMGAWIESMFFPDHVKPSPPAYGPGSSGFASSASV